MSRAILSFVAAPLSLDLADATARPYFLWDTGMSLGELREALRSENRVYWMARVMRDARYADVWKLLSLREVLAHWTELEPRLGRERERWRFLIEGWREDGLIP